MRDHQTIISQAGRDEEVAEAIGGDAKPFNVRDWRLRNRIPAERWVRVASLGWATLEELAAAVAKPDTQGKAA